jgi:hypothetical protein
MYSKKEKKKLLEQGNSSNLSYLCTVIMFRPLLAVTSNVKDFEESLQQKKEKNIFVILVI